MIVDDPVPYDLGALCDWSVLVFGLECGRMTEGELIASAGNKHDPATDVAWLELKRRAMLDDDAEWLAELEAE